MSTVSLSQIPSVFLNPDPDTGIDIHAIDLAGEHPESFSIYGPEDGSMLAIAWDSLYGYDGTETVDPNADNSKMTGPNGENDDDGDDGSVFLMSLNFQPSEGGRDGYEEIRSSSDLPTADQICAIDKVKTFTTGPLSDQLACARVALQAREALLQRIRELLEVSDAAEGRRCFFNKEKDGVGNLVADHVLEVHWNHPERFSIQVDVVHRLIHAICRAEIENVRQLNVSQLLDYTQSTFESGDASG
ncbi:hypothetical protein FFLO_05870 [Filobasidium floriforme]|uniref:Uncharacterized protein n=1 Tax=Filobasidium floriforme TaxID=5210 RepID=A0A8K0JHU1_9TREE|nr:uncharacterized protein HD553DRAFT_358683 [Filobasidium floriforme]KAG7528971.1 hypothetical protein FFLO_05870 [Filobasidium floriforme]KAH8081745.1 hypothetical protein HD553DRAFT_358683 [Filobasidium floriforme]